MGGGGPHILKNIAEFIKAYGNGLKWANIFYQMLKRKGGWEVVLNFCCGHWKCPNREWGKGHFRTSDLNPEPDLIKLKWMKHFFIYNQPLGLFAICSGKSNNLGNLSALGVTPCPQVFFPIITKVTTDQSNCLNTQYECFYNLHNLIKTSVPNLD